MQGSALRNTGPSTPTAHDSVATNYFRFVHSEPFAITNFVSVSHLITLLAYIFINAFWERAGHLPHNASTGSEVCREGTTHTAGCFPAERWFNPDRCTAKVVPSRQKNKHVTISQKDNPCKPHPLEKMTEA